MELAFPSAFTKTAVEKTVRERKKHRQGDRETGRWTHKNTQRGRLTKTQKHRQKLMEEGRRGHLPFISHSSQGTLIIIYYVYLILYTYLLVIFMLSSYKGDPRLRKWLSR